MADATPRIEKLKARLVGSSNRGEVVANAGAIFDYFERHGGSWEDLFSQTSARGSPCNCNGVRPRAECLQDLERIRKASRYPQFLSMSDRERLIDLSANLENGAPLPVGDVRRWLDEIYLRTGA